jgi:hypothetical protein
VQIFRPRAHSKHNDEPRKTSNIVSPAYHGVLTAAEAAAGSVNALYKLVDSALREPEIVRIKLYS